MRKLLLIQILVMAVFVMAYECLAIEAVDRFRMSRVKARAEAYVEEGRRDLERGAYMKSIRVLSVAISKGAGNEAYELRSRAYEAVGSKDLALKDLNHVIASRSTDPSGYVVRADAATSMNYYERAISDYDRAIELDPFFIDAYLGRGAAFAAMEKYELSIRDFELALKIDQNNPEALYNMGIICVLAGLPEAGKDFINRALDQETIPTNRDRLIAIKADSPSQSEYETRKGGIKGIMAELAKNESSKLTSSDNTEAKRASKLNSNDQVKADGHAKSNRATEARELLAKIGKEDFSGTSFGNYMGLEWKASFKFSGNTVTGTLKIVTPSGKQEVHHGRGTFTNGVVEASDNLGFRFSGRVTDDFKLVGSMTTNDGKSFSIDIPLDN
jgi:tetratricopeptide (TPR) repeat protein